MKKIYSIVILSMALLAVGNKDLKAQQPDYKYHSMFIYNFTKYIKYPDASVGNEFIIGVVGKSSITEHLIQMAEIRKVNGAPIVIKTFNSPTEITECHMLFLPENYSSKFSEVQSKLSGKHTLLISEYPGLAQKGSDINFIVNQGRWNFELNQASTDQRNLKVSSELTKFAKRIYTEI